MSWPTDWLPVTALLGLLLGLLLLVAGNHGRRRAGLGGGVTLSLDRVTLRSTRLGLVGRPDRLIRQNGQVIIEEWKSARVVGPWHRAQMGVYFLLAEEHWGIRPSHGFLVGGDGSRHRIDNTAELRACVTGMVEQIRRTRQAAYVPLTANPTFRKCQVCGQAGNCDQAAK